MVENDVSPFVINSPTASGGAGLSNTLKGTDSFDTVKRSATQKGKKG